MCTVVNPAPPSTPAVSGTPFPFQQNPCTFPNWEVPIGDDAETIEIEEAAADMFLNWVYDEATPEGFTDTEWRGSRSGSPCYPTGCADNAASGQARSDWMNNAVMTLINEFGW